MNIALESEKVIPLESNRLEMLKQIADALAAQFGPNCEVVIHDLSAQNAEHPIVYIVNGHVTGRKVGDGASYVVVEQLTTNDPAPRDHLAYLTRTPDGKILKSSTVYIRNSKGKVSAILAINYDISKLLMVESAVHDLISTGEPQQEEPEKIVNVNDLLEELIQQSVSLVGKPVAPDEQGRQGPGHPVPERVRGRFLVTKSGDKGGKILRYFQIHSLFLHRRKQRRRQINQEEKKT